MYFSVTVKGSTMVETGPWGNTSVLIRFCMDCQHSAASGTTAQVVLHRAEVP